MPQAMTAGTRDRATAQVLRFLPLAGIVALQLLFFPVPLGIWVKGAIVGGLTALVALGMALTWRSNGVVSFAQGDLGMAPVVLVHLLMVSWGWSWWLAVPSGLLVAALLGATVEIAIIRRFRRAPRLLLTVATIGLGQALAGVAILLPRLFDEIVLAPRIEPPFDLDFSIGGVNFFESEVLSLIAVPVAVGLLALLLQRSQVGLAARAAADSTDRASLLGIPVGRIQTMVWSLAAVLAFIAVLFRAGVLGLPVGAALSLGVLLRALTALLVGRLTDLPVIAATSVLLGVLELSVAFNASNTVIIDPILAGVVAVALLLRGGTGRRGVRTAESDATAWRSSDEVRPVPRELGALLPVRLARTGGVALLVAIGIALPYLLPVDKSLKSSAVLIYALLGCSVVVLTGWAGQVSLGQVAIFAIGAAVGAKATLDWDLDLLLAIPVAGIAGAVAAVVVGFPALRLRGLELAVVTLAAAIATTSWLLNPRFFDWVPSSRIARPPLLGRFSIESPTAIHHLSFALLLLGLLALKGIRASRTGRALLALRDNERGAQAYGLSPLRLRLTAFAMSGAIAAAAGAMFAHHQQAFGSQPYLPAQNIAVFTMVVLGGVGSVAGAVIGALWFQGLRWFLPGEWQLLASGVGVLFILLIFPGGVGGLLVRLRDTWLGRVATKHGLDIPGFTAAALGMPLESREAESTPARNVRHSPLQAPAPGAGR